MIFPALRRGALAGAAAVLTLAAGLQAQHSEPPVPAAFALTDVTVVRPDGSRQEGLTLVTREELIQSLRADSVVPADARRLEGDSLWIYPGLVDAEGEPRHEFPSGGDGEEEADGRPPVPWAPDRRTQGFLAHRKAADALQATGSDLSGARKAGVVASGVLPDDAALPGRGAVLLHRKDADTPSELVLEPVLGPVMAFEPAGRVYPGTHFGVVAFLRQQLEDADRYTRVAAAHGESPRGMAAPRWDPDLEVLGTLGAGEGRVLFRAHGASDIRQAVEMAARYGFRLAIVGGREAWQVADLLRRHEVPVLVSTDFPTPKRWDPDEEETAPDTAAADVAAGQEIEPEVLREKRRIESARANASRLAEAGVTVALTSGGGEAELREGARKAVEYGLPEQEAVRSLTSVPARLLGVPWLARVEPGMPATFVVADGPLLEEDTDVIYTFVEGRLEEGEVPGEAPDEPPSVDVSGSWDLEVEGDMGTLEATLVLEQDGGRLEGSLEADFGTMDVASGTVSGSDVSFTVVFDMGGESAELSFSGTAEGSSMSGTGSGPPQMGSFTWEATRAGPGPGGAR